MILVYYQLWDSSMMVRFLQLPCIIEGCLLSFTSTPLLSFISFLSITLTGYQPHLYFWDMITFLRNILLSVIIVFLDSSSLDGNYQQGLAALLVFLCSTGLHFMYLPYVDQELNYLEALGLIVSMMTLYLGLWTFTITSDVSIVTASVLIFIINIMWLLCVMGVLFSSFGKTLKRVKDYMYRLPCLCKRRDREEEATTTTATSGSSAPPLVKSSDVVLEMGVMLTSPSFNLSHSSGEKEAVISKVNPLHEGRRIQEASKKSKPEVYIRFLL